MDLTGVAGLLVACPAELHLSLEAHHKVLLVASVKLTRNSEHYLIAYHLELGGNVLREVQVRCGVLSRV